MAIATNFTLPTGPEWRLVTPAYAAWLLDRNKNNRRVRDSHVEFFVRIMVNGQFEPTTDGVGIRKDGILTNGQHRLMAIVQSGIPQRLLLVPDMSEESYKTQDQNASPRTAAETLGVSHALVSDVTLLLNLMYPSIGKQSRQETEDALEWWRPAHHALLIATQNTFKRGFAGSNLRVAAGLRWAIADNDIHRVYVLSQMGALIAGEVTNMSVSTGSLYRRMVTGKYSSGTREHKINGLLLMFQSLDPLRRDTETILRDPDRVRELVVGLIKQMADAYMAAPKAGHPYLFKDLTLPRYVPNPPHRSKGIKKARLEAALGQIN